VLHPWMLDPPAPEWFHGTLQNHRLTQFDFYQLVDPHAPRQAWSAITDGWFTDAMRRQSGADIAFQNTAGIRAEMKKGPVKMRDIYQVMPFENTLVKLTMTGAQLKELLTDNLRGGKSKLQLSGVTAKFQLPPSGSLLLFLSQKPTEAELPRETASTLAATGPVRISRLEPNVLTLDYVDVTAGGESRKNLYFYQANQFAWQMNGLERNPWDSAVQFKDELIRKTFPPGSGFTASCARMSRRRQACTG